MTTYRKKLIEVALPLEAINVASAREKSIRHGHPSTLHLWWARRPLAACRAVLFASLVDDPDSDPAYANYDAETREHMTGEKRQQLFDLITELVQWENSNNELVINAARAEIARCVASRKIELGELKKDHKIVGGETVYDLVVKGHGDLPKLREGKSRLPNAESVNAFLAEHAPPVLDPFAGGGSIPLEAQRLGLRAYASDLNPVPVLINKALIEIPPQFANLPPVNPESRGEAGPAGKRGKGRGKSLTGNTQWRGARGLAEDVRYYGKWMRDEAEKRIGQLYPKVKITAAIAKKQPELAKYVGEELTVIAWLWCRTVLCPNPACGARMPIARSFTLSRKPKRPVYVQPILDQTAKTVTFDVRYTGVPPEETSTRLGARCLFCGNSVKKDVVRQQSMSHGLKEIPLAAACLGNGHRVYVPFKAEDVPYIDRPSFPEVDQPITNDRRWFSPPLYGMPNFADLFTSRQLAALGAMGALIGEVRDRLIGDDRASDGARDQGSYADAICLYLALAFNRSVDRSSSICTWDSSPKMEALRNTFARQAIQMTWDFAEGNPFSESSGNWMNNVEWVANVVEGLAVGPAGHAQQIDATSVVDPRITPMVSTDPPYYDNIGYADLSDFFYVWLRRNLRGILPNLFSTILTPKSPELVASPHRFEGGKSEACKFFEEGLGRAFVRMRDAQVADIPLTVYYAFKQTESGGDGSENGDAALDTKQTSTGWETMLEGLIRAGFAVTGTWPCRTELANRMVGRGTNALASSIALVCRARPKAAPLATRREFLNALKHELPAALKKLQRGNIAPVDLAQASIGPGMAVFTRYAKVMEADGSQMNVRQALSLVNQIRDEVLAHQEGEFDGDTRWAVAWFEQFGMDEGAFGVAETLSKAKNTAVNALVEAGLIAARAGKVRLLKREELPPDWNPATDNKVRHWEVAQHLIHALETGGETAAADLLRHVGGMGEVARDLAYRLYNLCERKKWASEALAYNGLVIAWPEIVKLAQSSPPVAREPEAKLF